MKASVLACALLAAPAFAAQVETAEVLSAAPVYGTLNEPRQQCWNETVTTYEAAPRSYGGTLLGGIAGGLIGSTIGRGDGRAAAAAAGAAIGALAGDQADRNHAGTVAVPRQVQRCQTVDSYRQGITGYNVTYDYHGRRYTEFMSYDPGPRVQVQVGVVAGPSPQPAPAASQEPRRVPSQQITYVDPDGNVPVWAYKPYKRPRPAD
ncbi:MAG TPA: glycine zipper 2TM domain-containing protein [Burkholderiales bacterium]|nr:glycine zipper 2TM domain-containing protein [Burkholderiales bacterium]